MTQCSNCGNRMEYINEYGKWYCHSCQRYSQIQAPTPYPTPVAVPPPYPSQPPQYDPYYGRRRQKMHPAIIAIIVIVIIVIIAAVFAIIWITNGDSEKKTVTMSVSELEDDTESEFRTDYRGYDYYSTNNYKSLDPGDTLELKDRITYIDYDPYDDETNIELDDEMDFYFEGDITEEYAEDDRVIITLKVIEIEYSTNEYGISIYYKGEIFDHMWDSENNEPDYYKTLPQSRIRDT